MIKMRRPFQKKVSFLFFLGLLVSIYQIWRSMAIPRDRMDENQEQGNAPDANLDFKVSSSSQAPKTNHRMQVSLSNHPSEVPAPKFNLRLANEEFTVTNFTPNVMDLLKLVSLKRVKKCPIRFHISVNAKGMVDAIQCYPPDQSNIVSQSWCKVLRDLFSDAEHRRLLPGNVTFGISDRDYIDYQIRKNKGCFGSSSPQGRFVVPNFLEIIEMAKHEDTSYNATSIPWNQRRPIPIWRGTLWQKGDLNMTNNASTITTMVDELSRQSSRVKAVLVSKQHLNLVDARISSHRGFLSEQKSLWEHNATNGLHRLLPLDFIPPDQYYTQHQVALVLGTFCLSSFGIRTRKTMKHSGPPSFSYEMMLDLTFLFHWLLSLVLLLH